MTDRTRQAAAALRLRLTNLAAKGEPATVRVTKHTNNAAIKDAALFPSREALDRRAVRHLIEAGRLAETYSQGLVTDYELADPAEDPDLPEPMPDPVTIDPARTYSTREAAHLFGLEHATTVNKMCRELRLTSEKEDPDNPRSPRRILPDKLFLAELDKRGIPYELVEAEAEAEPVEPVEPEAPAPAEEPITWFDLPAKDEPKAGAGVSAETDELSVAGEDRGGSQREAPPRRHPADTLVEELEAARAWIEQAPPLQQAGEMIRSAHYLATRVRDIADALRIVAGEEAGRVAVLTELLHEEAFALAVELEAADGDLARLARRDAAESFTVA